MLRADAEVDRVLLEALLTNHPGFPETWGRRRDFPSQSEYDLAIANAVFAAEGSDEQAAAFIIAHRRRHGQDVGKVLMPGTATSLGYTARTLAKARAPGGDRKAPSERQGPKGPPEDRVDSLAKVRGASGVPVARVRKVGRERGVFLLDLDDGRSVSLGQAADLLILDRARARIFDAAGVVLREMKRYEWFNICKELHALAEVVEAPESGVVAEVKDHLDPYLQACPCFRDENWTEALCDNEPFRRDGKVWLHLEAFSKFLFLEFGERRDKPALRAALTAAGFECQSVTGRVHGRVVHRSYWAGTVEPEDTVTA